MFFIFASLLEYAIINSYMRQADKYEKLGKQYAKKGNGACTLASQNNTLVSTSSDDDFQTPISTSSTLVFSSPRIKIVDNGETAPTRYCRQSLLIDHRLEIGGPPPVP